MLGTKHAKVSRTNTTPALTASAENAERKGCGPGPRPGKAPCPQALVLRQSSCLDFLPISGCTTYSKLTGCLHLFFEVFYFYFKRYFIIEIVIGLPSNVVLCSTTVSGDFRCLQMFTRGFHLYSRTNG